MSFLRRHSSLLLVYALLFAFFSAIAVHYSPQTAALAFFGANAVAYGLMVSPNMGAVLTMLDIAKQTGNDVVVGLIEENASAYPEFTRFPARTIRGTSYKTLHRTDYPLVGFRGANQGTPLVKSSWANKLTECFIIDAQVRADKAVADAHEDGPEVAKAREASGVMLGAMRGISNQIYYGVANDAKGFPGLAATVDASHVVDVAGVAKSSVYAIKFGLQDIILVGGNGKAINMADVWGVQQVADPADATKFFTAYVNALMGWIGLQLANKDAFGRIKGLGADTEAGKLMNDDLAADLLATMPANWRPDMWAMNRRSLNQLRKSRKTPENPRPPVPTEIEGVPIMVTDAITNAEAI